jgi:polyisoprenoid-binding protein YceI
MARWEIDPKHSLVEVAAKHMMLATVKARFKIQSAVLEFEPDDPSRSFVEATVDAASVDTGIPERDAHLRSPDFLDVERFPHVTFRSTRVEQPDPRRGRVIGDLTIRDVTREVELGVRYAGRGKSPSGDDVVAFSATTAIDRRRFGITWNQALEAGGILVSNELRIDIEVEAKALQRVEATTAEAIEIAEEAEATEPAEARETAEAAEPVEVSEESSQEEEAEATR